MSERPSVILVGVHEIAERAGVKEDTVQKWRIRHAATFPAPVAALAMGPVWDWTEVSAWLLVRQPIQQEVG